MAKLEIEYDIDDDRIFVALDMFGKDYGELTDKEQERVLRKIEEC